MSGSRGLLLVVLTTQILAGHEAAYPAVDCSLPDGRLLISSGATINISSAQFSASDLGIAVAYWTACDGYGTDMPSFTVGGAGGIPVTVNLTVGRSTSPSGSCGLALTTPTPAHAIASVEITVWTHDRFGVSCEPLTDVIAHELGHAYGLADAGDGPACRGHIMGDRLPGGTRSVFPDDCVVADDMWEVPSETDFDPFCDVYCWTSCVNNQCPPWSNPNDACPVLIDLEGDGFHMTGLTDPVVFDIDADGNGEVMGWTNRGDAFLVLDRNSNGLIDHGGELFGNYSRLASGSLALNGYEALADFDSVQLGGNADGLIDASDEIFTSLKVWTDVNHNGVSEPKELQSLTLAGVVRLDLRYHRSNRTDALGNEFRFLSRAWVTRRNGRPVPRPTWDVFFVVQP